MRACGMVAAAIPALTPHPARNRVKPIAHGRMCEASGKGLEGGTAGVCSSVSIVCKDSAGKRLTTGGDVVVVTMKPELGPSVDAHVVDNTDGTYVCSYLPATASPRCRVAVTVNGAHLPGSPFFATVLPGKTDSRQSEVFGQGLHDGMSGSPCRFTIQTKDTYGNRCWSAGDKFSVVVKPLQSLVAELETFVRKTEVATHMVDNEDGTHSVEYTVDFAGFYSVEVTHDNIPVGDSPYQTCIVNASIAFPPALSFSPFPAANNAVLPSRKAQDYCLVHDMLVLVKSDPGAHGMAGRGGAGRDGTGRGGAGRGGAGRDGVGRSGAERGETGRGGTRRDGGRSSSSTHGPAE